jgi:predicted transcriptional regulator of viral defense system
MHRIVHRQADQVLAILKERGMARLSELTNADATAATVARMERSGEIIRLARGLYQLPAAPIDVHHSLAEAAKLVPNGVICLQSALAFHGLTGRIPPSVWIAIGPKEWRPKITTPPIQIMRFGPKVFDSGIEDHVIEGVPIRIYGPAKSIVDEFRVSRMADILYDKGKASNLTGAIETLKTALRQRKVTPAEISKFALEAGPRIWSHVRPYLEALTIDA